MKGTLAVLSVFALGCLAGWSGLLDLENLGKIGPDLTMYVLYLLIFLVGVSMGCNPDLKKILKGVSPKLFLLPLATISGTLLFSALASLLISEWNVFDCLAVGSGMGYYSLSSVLISQYKEASLGMQMAAELGTIALLANIFREMFTLVGTPLLARWFGRQDAAGRHHKRNCHRLQRPASGAVLLFFLILLNAASPAMHHRRQMHPSRWSLTKPAAWRKE